MRIDKTKSVAEISGKDWGPPPPTSTFRSRQRYEARRQALKDLTYRSIGLLLTIDFETDAEILIPYALSRLGDSFSKNDHKGLLLLTTILKNTSYEWTSSPEDVAKARSACKNWLNTLDNELSIAESTSDQLEYYRKGFDILWLQNHLLEGMVEWERRLDAQ